MGAGTKIALIALPEFATADHRGIQTAEKLVDRFGAYKAFFEQPRCWRINNRAAKLPQKAPPFSRSASEWLEAVSHWRLL
ncbi:MAG: hypothetical protein A2095_11605 [Sphingomonadales bacterium GWF1_63_6]|nr:MAG: hypothetical protein A2095_11605 [Sphingomonadales bacterium GWF1_63_6]OHD01915.1 MAG: hypothetical protein A3H25_17250 [Sphingomonadales bacterium RIFCSPLOWO2_12_FULL_63_15]